MQAFNQALAQKVADNYASGVSGTIEGQSIGGPLIQASVRLGSALNSLDGQINALEKAMEHVLRPGFPKDQKAKELREVTPVRSPLTTGMHQEADRVDQLVARVQSMRDRLET